MQDGQHRLFNGSNGVELFGWRVPRVVMGTQTLKAKPWPWIPIMVVATFLALGILPELVADRFDSGALSAVLPAHGLVARAASATSIIAAGVICFSAFFYLGRPKTGRDAAKFNSQALIWVPYCIAWGLSAVLGGISGADQYGLLSLGMVFTLAIMRVDLIEKQFMVRITAWAFRIIISVSLLFAVLNPPRAFAPYEVWPGGWWEGADRLQGVLPHPNSLGWIAALATIFELYTRRKLWLAYGMLSVLAMLLTGSRTASLALLAGLVTGTAWLLSRRSRLLGAISLTWSPFLFLLSMLAIVAAGITAESFNGRIDTWSMALESFSENFILGSGPAAFLSDESGTSSVPYAHNQFLHTAAEMGVLGLVALLTHMVFLIKFVLRNAMSPLGTGLVAMWFVLFLTENLLRFAWVGFTLQILLFQLCLYSAGPVVKRGRPAVPTHGLM